MRVIGLLIASVLLGAGAIAGWFYFGTDGALPLVEKAPLVRERSKVRYAPYVVLAPAKPLPDIAAPAATPAQAPERQRAKPEQPGQTKVATRTPPPRAPEPATAPPAPKTQTPSSDVARQALEAIVGADKKPAVQAAPTHQDKTPAQPREPVESAPSPEPQARSEQPASEPATVPAPDAAPASGPAPATAEKSQQKTRARARLKYEIETDRQAKDREKQKSLLAKGTVRFRRVIPVSPGRIKAGENMVILAGVQALDGDAQCTYSSGAKWNCGKWGTFALRRFIRSRSVVCDLVDEISPSEMTGRCKVGGTDVSKWVIRRGWGKPAPDTQDIYAADLDAAKSEKLGQWSVEPKSDS